MDIEVRYRFFDPVKGLPEKQHLNEGAILPSLERNRVNLERLGMVLGEKAGFLERMTGGLHPEDQEFRKSDFFLP